MRNVGMGEMMARILTGCNATSYMISSGLCFWLIERCGRRVLMLSGLSFQCLAYVMVAISIALLDQAPFQVGGDTNRFSIELKTKAFTVGNRRRFILILLLRSIWLYLGNGSMGLSGGDQLSRHENRRCRGCNCNKLGM